MNIVGAAGRRAAACGWASIVVCLVVAAEHRPHAQETGVIRGTVVDQDGHAVVGARVVMARLRSTTDRFEAETGFDGRYAQEALAAGVYAVTADKDELSGETFRVRVRSGRTVRVHFLLEPGLRVSTWLTALSEREALSSVFAAGVEANRSRDFEEAIDLFNRAIELSPTCVECNFNLAVAYVEVGELAAAEASFKRVLDITPNYTAAYYGLSNVYTQQGRRAEAVEVRGEANRLALERLATWRAQATDAVARGLTFLNAGNIVDAQRRFRDALEKDINHAPAHYWLGVSLMKSNVPDRAADSFRRYLRLEGDGEFAELARQQLASIEP